MRKTFFLLLGALTFQTTICQSKCSDLIRTFSKEWKLDSLTRDGYRSRAFKFIRQSLADSVSPEDLINYLGKPAKIQRFYSGNSNKNYIQYEYFYWDSYTIPKESPFERLYIAFVFDQSGSHLQYIDDGMYCR